MGGPRRAVALRAAQQPQQTGIPFIRTQQVQPAFIMALQQSQHAWIMAQQSLSPLVQVIVQPFSVISHLHMPIIRLQQQAIIPFHIMQQLHIPPDIIVQRFCSIPAVIFSSLVQVIFIPPVHFSIFSVQRGTIIMFMVPGLIVGALMAPAPGDPIPGIPIPLRSIIIALVMEIHLIRRAGQRSFPGPSERPVPDDHYDKHKPYFNFGFPEISGI
jgi:hypothetical protein